MIVKNAARDLRPCLESVRGLVSQIVIADTGSSDNTMEIAKEFGAAVIPIRWTNHFADARNAALQAMTTDWVLVLDADEELTPQAVSAIPALIERSDGIGGYLLIIRNYLPELQVQFRSAVSVSNTDSTADQTPRARSARSWAEHNLCRLFRRLPEIRYEGRVHEVVEHAIARCGLRIEPSLCRILHFGQLAIPEEQARKSAFYRELGRAKVLEEPENGLAWFELGGIELTGFNNQAAALQCLLNAVRLEPHLFEAWILLFHLYDQRGEFGFALDVYNRLATQAQSLGAAIPFHIVQRCGDYLHDRGELLAACGRYQSALDQAAQNPNEASPASCRAVESKLGYTQVRLGQIEGLKMLARAAVEASGIRENHQRLIKALLIAGHPEGAAEAAHFAATEHPSFGQLAAAIRLQAHQTLPSP